MIYELNLNDNKTIARIKEFLKDNDSDYMQDIKWNIIRNETKKYYLYYVEDEKIIWLCNLLEKEKDGEKVVYAPRGPVLKDSNPNLLNKFLSNINKWLKDHNYNKIIINPILRYEDLDKISSKYKYTITKHNDYTNLMESSKLAIMDIIYNPEELIRKLPSKHRQNTRRSYRKNLKFNISNKVDINNFYNLYLQTAERHNFNPHTKEYFKKIIKTYEKELVFLEVWYEDMPLAMSIDIVYNNKLIYLYGVSSTQNRNLLGMYNLQWEAIKYCINNKIPKYDFGGVFCEENDYENKDYGLYTFKKGYCYTGFIDVVPDLTFDFKEVDYD